MCVSDRFRVQKVKPHIQRHRERERRGRGESSFVCFIFFSAKLEVKIKILHFGVMQYGQIVVV